jgi:hypothetical protein
MYLLGHSLVAAIVERRVSARRGWAGETDDLFDHSQAKAETLFRACC